jgi:ribosomal protein S27E
MDYWIEYHYGNHDGQYDIKCPECDFEKELYPSKGEKAPNFCENCGKKLHVKDKIQEKTSWVKNHYGNNDGRYDIKCPECDFEKEIHPSKGEKAPKFCPKCGKNNSA